VDHADRKGFELEADNLYDLCSGNPTPEDDGTDRRDDEEDLANKLSGMLSCHLAKSTRGVYPTLEHSLPITLEETAYV
jgi:hypothetical protein